MGHLYGGMFQYSIFFLIWFIREVILSVSSSLNKSFTETSNRKLIYVTRYHEVLKYLPWQNSLYCQFVPHVLHCRWFQPLLLKYWKLPFFWIVWWHWHCDRFWKWPWTWSYHRSVLSSKSPKTQYAIWKKRKKKKCYLYVLGRLSNLCVKFFI